MPSLRARSTVIKPPDAPSVGRMGRARNDSAGTPRRRVSGLIYSLPAPPQVRGDSIIRHRRPSPAHRARALPSAPTGPLELRAPLGPGTIVALSCNWLRSYPRPVARPHRRHFVYLYVIK